MIFRTTVAVTMIGKGGLPTWLLRVPRVGFQDGRKRFGFHDDLDGNRRTQSTRLGRRGRLFERDGGCGWPSGMRLGVRIADLRFPHPEKP